jgi:hypothetical protein
VSTVEDRDRARGWLEEQLEQLDKLRNANPRDPSFKLWRQNTLTVLQRIWPAQPFRSERFRRIAFSPAASKAAGALVREYFSRGCAETVDYLRSLIEEVELIGMPEAAVDAQPAPFVGESPDADVPMLDLSGEQPAGPPRNAPGYAMEENVLDLGAPKGPARRAGNDTPPHGIPRLPVKLRTPGTTPELEAAADAAPSLPRGFNPLDGADAGAEAPAPPAASRPHADPEPTVPQLPAVPAASVEVGPPAGSNPTFAAEAPMDASVPTAPGVPTIPHLPPATESDPPASADEAAPAPRRAARAARPRKNAPRGKLKNMLGLDHLDALAESVSPAAAPSAAPSAAPPAAAHLAPAAAAEPPMPAPPVAAPPAAQAQRAAPSAPAEPPMPAPPVAAPVPTLRTTLAPVPRSAARPAPPAAAAPAPPAQPAPTAAPPAAEASPPVPAPAASPAAGAAPVPDEEAATFDPATLSRATADFLRNSPVLGLQGRPVQRTSDVTQFLEPDAVAISTFAAELGRLGVPEDARPGLRSALNELAQQVETGKPEWVRLRAVVNGAMEHPELARRLVPVLLPWLDRAA